MKKTPMQIAALIAAIGLLFMPGYLLPVVLPRVFHLRTLRLIAAIVLTWPVTLPLLMRACRYYHQSSPGDAGGT